MTALEYMEKQYLHHCANYMREKQRGAPEHVVENIRLKIHYYLEAVQALKEVNK